MLHNNSSTSSLPPSPPSQNGNQPPRACAACKHQRKKCVPTCVFAPYFPPGLAREFDMAQKLFGVSNMVKMASKIPESQRHAFFDSIVFEAEERHANPVAGCTGQLHRLRRQNVELRGEVEKLRERLRLFESFCPNVNGNGNGNNNGFVGYPFNSHQRYVNVHGTLGNGNGFGFPLNGTVLCNGLQAIGDSPYWPEGDKRSLH